MTGAPTQRNRIIQRTESRSSWAVPVIPAGPLPKKKTPPPQPFLKSLKRADNFVPSSRLFFVGFLKDGFRLRKKPAGGVWAPFARKPLTGQNGLLGPLRPRGPMAPFNEGESGPAGRLKFPFHFFLFFG